MKHLDLFSGIGGFALAASWVWKEDHEIISFCEIGKYPQRVLKKHWPDVPICEDVRKLDGKNFKNIDLITAGFPCQDISTAGKQRGIHGERSGLYDEIIRIGRVCRPRFILLENVANLITRPEWIGYVLGRLSEIGYNAEWEIIRASDVGAPHRRARVWIMAYPSVNGNRRNAREIQKKNEQQKTERQKRGICEPFNAGEIRQENVADTSSIRCNMRRFKGEGIHREESTCNEINSSCEKPENVADSDSNGFSRVFRKTGQGTNGSKFRKHINRKSIKDMADAESKSKRPGFCENESGKIGGRRFTNGGIEGSNWTVEPELGRVAHGIPDRVDRLKGLGNAIVPQCAVIIMEQIKNLMESEV